VGAGRRVVKAFSHLAAPILRGDPEMGDGHRARFLAGDDQEATATVASLMELLGSAEPTWPTSSGDGCSRRRTAR